jgi:hypothetical protein
MVSIHRWAIAAGITGFATCLLTACGGQEESSKDAARQRAVERARAALTPEPPLEIERGEKGEIRYSGETRAGESFEAQLGGDVVLPKSFPQDIPVYPNAVPFSAMEIGGGTSIVSLDSDAKPSEVYEFYKEKLAASGWKLENELTVGGGRVLTAVKGDRKAVLNIEGTEDGTRFGFMLGPVI